LYRFGFNGKEKEDDVSEGAYDFGARMYDSRTGKFFSVDPLFKDFSSESNYSFAGNSPIILIDYNGEFKVSPSFQRDFPKLTLYIMKNIEADMQRENIKNLFIERTGISETDYNEMVKPDHGPTITSFIGFGVGHNGAYESGQIKINKGLLYLYKFASTEKFKNIALYFIFKKIVHEASHYADYKADGVQMEENETVIGEGLEKDIFHKLDPDPIVQEVMPGEKLDEDILSDNPDFDKDKYDENKGEDRLKHSAFKYDTGKMENDYNNVRDADKDVLPTPVK